jgi:hypothetical protein
VAREMSHLSDYLVNTRMGRPWDHLSPEQKPLDMQRDCTEPDTGPASRSHSFEGCTAVSGLAMPEVTGHSAADYTSAAAGIGQHTTMRMKSLVAKQHCCSGILLATVALVRQSVAECM